MENLGIILLGKLILFFYNLLFLAVFICTRDISVYQSHSLFEGQVLMGQDSVFMVILPTG